MAERFSRGDVAYTPDGRSYRVDDIEDGIVYCSTTSGAETEYPADQLLTSAEWKARAGAGADRIYGRLKLSEPYTTKGPSLDKGAGERVLSAISRLMPALLDFAAYQIAADVLRQSGEGDQVAGLSIVKCRAVFDSAPLDIRIGLLARTLGVPPKTLTEAAQVGDNLMRAILTKGMAAYEESLTAFRARR